MNQLTSPETRQREAASIKTKSPYSFKQFTFRRALVFATAVIMFSGIAGPSHVAETANPPILSASKIDYTLFCIANAEGQAGCFSVELLGVAFDTETACDEIESNTSTLDNGSVVGTGLSL